MTVQRSILFSIIAVGLFSQCITACTKDKFTTKPQLKFLRAENYTVPRGGLISFRLQFTDKEGDLTDSIFIQAVTTKCTQSNRKLIYAVPTFPSSTNIKGEFEINFVNGQFVPGYVALPGPACGKPDTTTFTFWVRDKARNVSDTVKTDKPIIILN